MNYASIIKEIGRGAKGARSMDPAHAEHLFDAMLDGTLPDLEPGAIIIALRVKSESLEELLGFRRAMDARCAQESTPDVPTVEENTALIGEMLSDHVAVPQPILEQSDSLARQARA